MPWTMTYQKYQTQTNQACPKSQSTCSTFGTSKLTHHISIDSDRDNREKNVNVCVTSAELEFTLKHEALKKFLWEYSHL